MILMPQIFDVIANENARYKRNELEWYFVLGRDEPYIMKKRSDSKSQGTFDIVPYEVLLSVRRSHRKNPCSPLSQMLHDILKDDHVQ